ncbi:reverse transcriptase [Elysia marginata]|uniref:Reverse transcriptase n=1 Tax=Elysia marginata TaxID=1093978 RepID=A0AAV4FKB8_9GAST|nr:reverse transcriptase [Elysia marginata]
MDLVKSTIRKEKKSHFASRIKNSGTSKGLYSVVNEVCGKLSSPVLPKGVPKKELPDRFARYFSDKISKLRQELDHDAEDPSTETAESVPKFSDHLKRNNLIEKFQSAYRNWHSTETALLRIVNDILLSCDDGNITVLTLLDLSAAFDTINHAILFERLSTNIGLGGNVLAFKSYLSGRTQSVKIDEHTSDDMPLKYGVPQGSVLGPVLYTLCTLSIAETIKPYSVGYHMYADDTQLYASGAPKRIGEVCKNIQDCCESVEAWMMANKLELNSEKTVVMYCGSQQKLKLIDNAPICFGNAKIIPSLTAKNLGVFLDSQMNMEKQDGIGKAERTKFIRLLSCGIDYFFRFTLVKFDNKT